MILRKLTVPCLTDHETLIRKFRYEGSLTTPECVEAVVWTIFKEPLVINTKTRDLILKTDSTKKVNNNFRTLMPVNDREGLVFEPILANSGRLIRKFFRNFGFSDHEPDGITWQLILIC